MICLSAVVSACQTANGQRSGVNTTDIDRARSSSEAAQLGLADPGTPVSLQATNADSARTVITGEEYNAASGRRCKALFTLEGKPLQQVVCVNSNDEWVIQRALTSEKTTGLTLSNGTEHSASFEAEPTEYLLTELAPTQPVPLAAVSNPLVTAQRIETTADSSLNTYAIHRESTETLWSFASRVTGDGNNWEAIANANNIDDARTLPDRGPLQVPTSLLLDTYRGVVK